MPALAGILLIIIFILALPNGRAFRYIFFTCSRYKIAKKQFHSN